MRMPSTSKPSRDSARAQAATYANTWLQEGSLNASQLTADLSFNAIRRSVAHMSGALTRTANRRLSGRPVAGIHSSQSGYLYVARSAVPYPVEFQLQQKGVHEVLQFSGWNTQPDPNAPATDIKVGTNQSYNWSGYVLPTSTGSVTQVDASWIEPNAICSPRPRTPGGSTWIGVDGSSNSRVFQVGTEVDCVKGAQIHYAWFENYPNPPQQLALAVNPGDGIRADLRQVSPGEWSYTLTDLTTGQTSSSSGPIPYLGPGTSAEWIEEDPGNHPEALSDFGAVSFAGVTVNGAPPSP